MEFQRLNDNQWAKVTKVLPPLPRRTDNRGRPWNDPREVLNGVLWVMARRTAWTSLPRGKYPPYQTCHRWFQRWLTDGTLRAIAEVLDDDFNGGLARCFEEDRFSAARGRQALT